MVSIGSSGSRARRATKRLAGAPTSLALAALRPSVSTAHRPVMPHIARQLGHDVAVPRRGTASTKNLSQRPTEASSRPVTPDRRKVGLDVSSIDGVTLSDGEGRGERAQCRLIGSRWGVPRHLSVIRTDQQFGDAWQSTQCASHLVEHPGHRPGVLRDGDGSRQPAVMGGPGNGPPPKATANRRYSPHLPSGSDGLGASQHRPGDTHGLSTKSRRRSQSPETGPGTRSGAANRPPSSHRRRSGSRRAAAVS